MTFSAELGVCFLVGSGVTSLCSVGAMGKGGLLSAGGGGSSLGRGGGSAPCSGGLAGDPYKHRVIAVYIPCTSSLVAAVSVLACREM